MVTALPPPFICAVVSVYDADGPIRCANGIKVRVAGINARETDGSCRSKAPCPMMRHEQAKPIVERLVLHKRLTCQPMGHSYQRVVARCTLPDSRSLSCAIIASGAGVKWDRYWRQYRMGKCR